MKTTTKKVSQLIKDGIMCPPIDGNHGEKHPKTTDYVDDGVPFILVPDLKDGVVDLDNCNHISYDQAKTLNKGFSRSGDVLFTHKATIGKVALVDTKGYEYIILTPQVTYYRVNKLDVLSNVYLYYYFCSNTFQNTFRLYASSGGTRDYLGIVAQQKLPIIFPDIDYQLRIVAILEKYDKLIRNNNKRIKLLENIVDNLYKEWFVRFRFPGHETTEFENGLPKDWKICKFSSVANILSGGTPKTEHDEYYGGDIPFYTPKDSTESIFVFETITKLSEDGLNHCNSQLFPQNTIMITARGTVGNLNMLAIPMAMNQSCYALNSEIISSQYFLFFLIKREIQKLKIMASGGVFDTIIVNTFDHIKVLLPTDELIKKFDCIVSSIMKEVKLLSKQNINLVKQRDLLLPRLMSGKLEV